MLNKMFKKTIKKLENMIKTLETKTMIKKREIHREKQKKEKFIKKNKIFTKSENLELFNKSELRIGQIKEISEIKNSENLYTQKINIGSETRSVISGLKKKFKKKDLEGKKVILLCNLKKRKIMNNNSEGMIICGVNDDDDEIDLLTPKGEIGDLLRLDKDFEDKKIENLKVKDFERFMGLFSIKNGVCFYDSEFLDFVENSKIDNGIFK